MKKILTAIVLMVCAISVKAQVYVGGSAGLWYDHDAKTTSFSLLPEVGYKFNEKWNLGTEIGIDLKGNSGSTSTTFIFTPYSRYTFAKAGKVNFFCDGTLELAVSKGNTGFGIGLKPGLSVEITDKLDFIGHVGFLGFRSDYLGHNGFGFALSGSDLNIGLNYTF